MKRERTGKTIQVALIAVGLTAAIAGLAVLQKLRKPKQEDKVQDDSLLAKELERQKKAKEAKNSEASDLNAKQELSEKEKHKQDASNVSAGERGQKKPGFRENSDYAGIRFRMKFLAGEQGENFKINLYDHGCGIAVGDIDHDGFDDVYFTNQLGANSLYRNHGSGTFEDVTESAGVGLADRICVAAAFADYDNDGDQDLYVTSTRGGNVFFKNQGQGKFIDATKEAGLTLIAHSQTATFFDYDNDGFLDLFVTNTAEWTLQEFNSEGKYYVGPKDLWQLAESKPEQNNLYHNNGNGTFSDVTEAMHMQGKGWGGDVAVFDYDHDGWPDVFVTNMFGANQFYHNDAGQGFTDVTKSVLGKTSWGAIGCKTLDFNQDGLLDLFVADMHSDMWILPSVEPESAQHPFDPLKKFRSVMGPSPGLVDGAQEQEDRINSSFNVQVNDVVFGNTLFLAEANGTFKEISDAARAETWWPWGVAVSDFDNNSFEDAFLPSGMGHPFGYWPSSLLMNDGSGKFLDEARSQGIEPPPGGRYSEEKIGEKTPPKSTRCAVTADLDDDGRVDLLVNSFNERAYYYHNEFPLKNYVAFRLTGSKSNRDAIGALVKIKCGDVQQVRQVQAAGGYLSQSTLTLHFGLGEVSKVDSVEIRWPSGTTQVLKDIRINTRHDITEPMN